MLADALESNRLFAVASRQEEPHEGIRPIGGLGIVRACVSNPDGTSNLILQGIARVRFDEWTTKNTYPWAQISLLEPEAVQSDQNPSLQKEILALLARWGESLPEHLLSLLEQSANASIFADLTAAAVITDPSIRCRLLEETHTTRRLEILASYLSNSTAFAG